MLDGTECTENFCSVSFTRSLSLSLVLYCTEWLWIGAPCSLRYKFFSFMSAHPNDSTCTHSQTHIMAKRQLKGIKRCVEKCIEYEWVNNRLNMSEVLRLNKYVCMCFCESMCVCVWFGLGELYVKLYRPCINNASYMFKRVHCIFRCLNIFLIRFLHPTCIPDVQQQRQQRYNRIICHFVSMGKQSLIICCKC